jgi:hypothetical protein
MLLAAGKLLSFLKASAIRVAIVALVLFLCKLSQHVGATVGGAFCIFNIHPPPEAHKPLGALSLRIPAQLLLGWDHQTVAPSVSVAADFFKRVHVLCVAQRAAFLLA